MKRIISINPWIILFLLISFAFVPASITGIVLKTVLIGFFSLYFICLSHVLFLQLPKGHDLSIQVFNVNLALSIVYFIFYYVIAKYYGVDISNLQRYGWWTVLIAPLLFVTGFSIFYCIYWVTKCLVTIEVGRTVTFSELAPNFFIGWFVFPVGIFWIITKIQNITSHIIS